MPAYQVPLPLLRPRPDRLRNVRRPFHPSPGPGPYRLPHDVRDRLAASLTPYRNRAAAFALAVFIARYHSVPGRIVDAFPIDRRALSEHGELGLTEKRVRNAIRTLEEIGFLDRAVAPGSPYKATEDGLRRKPIQFMFGSNYAPAFMAANKRAAAARSSRSGERRAIPPEGAWRASPASFKASPVNGPKNKNPSERTVILGPLVKESGLPAKTSDPNSKLEAALARLEEATGFRRGS